MGIPGLTTYINNRPDRFLKYYELRDTYLIIDGNSVCFQIYILHARCNCTFGGDYDRFAQYVSNFFNDLLKCNVTPLVLFDGGSENKKLRTIIARTKEKIHTASSFSPLSQPSMKFFPLLMTEVFKDVMREKNIRYAQCLFEADNDIAAAARILNCPVLSYDSDFYVYGVSYIPFNTLDNYIVKSSTGRDYMKRCKVYRVEYLLNSFRGLDRSMLPLAAILLGNDYVKQGTFKNFFRHLKLREASRRRHSRRQCRIEATFVWLSKYTLNNAIIGILSRLAKPYRPTILKLIESNINSYTNASAEILIPLGFPRDYVSSVNTYHLNRSFEFNEDIGTLTYIEETRDGEEEDNETSEEEDEGDEIDLINPLNETDAMSENSIVGNLPAWFVNSFLMARYPPYFMDLIVRRLYICSVQIEDCCYPPSIVPSLKIISLIFGLLKSALDDKVDSMRYMTRAENERLTRYELAGTETLKSRKLPSLHNLTEIPLIMRRDILNDTLGITNTDCMNELPPYWTLYVGCMKYWVEEQRSSAFDTCCLYSLFVCMLFDAIDSSIGKHRIMYNFQCKYDQIIKAIKERRKAQDYKPSYTTNGTIAEAYREINHDDCLLAAPFFISHFNMDRKLCANPKKFNRSVVHAFAEFQNCLKHAMNLNALLGYPYPSIPIAKLFNGTLLYNLTTNFKTRHDVEGYINNVLQESPSLLRFFNVFLLKVKPMFALLQGNGINPRKCQRTKSKHSKTRRNSAENDNEYFSAEETLDEVWYDKNNPFSLLTRGN